MYLWKLWKGNFRPFSSVIPSWKAFPLVEGFSRPVEREGDKKREEADASSLSELASSSSVSLL